VAKREINNFKTTKESALLLPMAVNPLVDSEAYHLSGYIATATNSGLKPSVEDFTTYELSMVVREF